MRKAVRRFIFILLGSLLLVLPAAAQGGQEKADAFYLEGVRQQLKGNYSEAFELFRHALEINQDLVGALYELSNYGHYMRNDSMATALVEQASAIDADNYWLKQALVQLYVDQKREEDAIAELERMAKQYPRKSEVLLMLADMYQRRKDYESVVRTLDRVELLEGKSERLSMEKFRIYVQMKDEKRAFAEMRALAEEYPNDVRYRVLIGDLYFDNRKLQQAYDIYRQIEAEHPDNINLQLSLAHYYQEVGDEEHHQQMLTRLLDNDQLDGETRVRIMQGMAMSNLQENGDTTQVMRLFRHLLQRPQKDVRIAELCVRYMVSVNASSASVKPFLHQMLSIDPEAELARNQLLSYAVAEADTNEVVRLCKTAVDYNSTDPVYYYYLGVGYFQLGKTKEALDALQRGLQKVDEKGNLTLLTNMYAISGDLYHQLGQDEKAFQAYDSCLLYHPDDALVLNNYAYYLSLRKQDLDRAEQMSRRSLEKEGANPTYLDTYAWILFQQKKYADARVYIDSVLVLLGDSVSAEDANLIEHAGDIYSRLGETEKAVVYWRKALSLGADDAAIIEEKIRKKKYVEVQ